MLQSVAVETIDLIAKQLLWSYIVFSSVFVGLTEIIF